MQRHTHITDCFERLNRCFLSPEGKVNVYHQRGSVSAQTRYFSGRICRELHVIYQTTGQGSRSNACLVEITEQRVGGFTLGLCSFSAHPKLMLIPLPYQYALRLTELRQETSVSRPILKQAHFAQELLQCFKDGLAHYICSSQKHVGRKLVGWFQSTTPSTELHEQVSALQQDMSSSDVIFQRLSQIMSLEALSSTHYSGTFKYIMREIVKKPYVLDWLNLAKHDAAGKA